MKNRRHKLIREIIEQQNIETQYQLTDALKGHGFSVSQATISRDIKELGLVKVATQENTFCLIYNFIRKYLFCVFPGSGTFRGIIFY